MKFAALVSLCLLSFSMISQATGAGYVATWRDAQRAAAYPLYRPANTDGLRRNQLYVAACMPRRPAIDAFYGTYRGVPGSRTVGFGLIEGNVSFCNDPGEYTTYGTVRIGGANATLSVWCPIGSDCPLASGAKRGYILTWTQRASRGQPLHMTVIHMDSSHLSLQTFIAIASSLVRVKRD